MDNIAPHEYADDKKQRLLIKNIRCRPCWRPFTQHCVDENLSYSKTAKYLRDYAIRDEHYNGTQVPEPPVLLEEHSIIKTYCKRDREEEEAVGESATRVTAPTPIKDKEVAAPTPMKDKAVPTPTKDKEIVQENVTQVPEPIPLCCLSCVMEAEPIQ